MTEANKTVINPFFVQAMRTMNADCSLENQNNMVDAMMSAHLLTPVVRQYREKPGINKANLRMSFTSIKNKNDESFILAFTDLVELKKWSKGKETDSMIMEFNDYAMLLADSKVPYAGFVINPFGENVTVTKSMTAKLMKKKRELEGM